MNKISIKDITDDVPGTLEDVRDIKEVANELRDSIPKVNKNAEWSTARKDVIIRGVTGMAKALDDFADSLALIIGEAS